MAFPQTSTPAETQISDFGTSESVNLPGTINSGALLIMFLAGETDTANGFDDPPASGWTTLWLDTDNSMTAGVAAKVATGSEGATDTVTGSSDIEGAAIQVYHITNWLGTIDGVEVGTVVNANSDASPDPPSYTASWGSDDNLWIAHCVAVDDDESVTGAPTNYTNLTSTISGAGTNQGCCVGTALRENTTDSENPLPFTLSGSETTKANTLVVRPGTAGTGGIQIFRRRREMIGAF